MNIDRSMNSASEFPSSVVEPQFAENSIRLSLRSNASWTLVGNLIYAACQWAMLVILAKLGSPEKVGCFALALAISAPAFMFSNLQLRVVQATDVAETYNFSDYLLLRLFTTGFALVVVVGIAGISRYTIETACVVSFVGLAKSFESISDVIYGLVQRNERMDLISRSMILKGISSIIAFGGISIATGSVVGAAAGLAGAWCAVLLTYDVRLARRFRSRAEGVGNHRCISRQLLVKMFRLALTSLPMGLTMMLISLNTNIPRYFIEHDAGSRALGFFAAIAYLMVAGNLVVNAIAQTALPRLARYYANAKLHDFRTLLLRLAIVAGVLGVVTILVAQFAGKQVLSIVYRSDYAGYSAVFTCLMMAAGIGYLASIIGCGMTAARLFNPQLPLNFAVVAVCALASWMCIPKLGLEGAALALLLSAVVQLVLSLVVLRRALRPVREQASCLVT